MLLTATSYHAQLVFILTKLPADVRVATCYVGSSLNNLPLNLQIGLEISYALVFSPDAPPITLANLNYERAAVLFNLGALFCQLAAAEDRSTAQGLKQAIAYHQVSPPAPTEATVALMSQERCGKLAVSSFICHTATARLYPWRRNAR